MNNTFTKADYERAAKEMIGVQQPLIKGDNGEYIWISDLLQNAITNIEIIEHYFRSVDPVISNRCNNCGQKLRVNLNDDKYEHRLDN